VLYVKINNLKIHHLNNIFIDKTRPKNTMLQTSDLTL